MHVTSQPDKIHDALDASVRVLRDISGSPINRRELQRARTTLVSRHETELKDNSYWLGLLTHLQVRQGGAGKVYGLSATWLSRSFFSKAAFMSYCRQPAVGCASPTMHGQACTSMVRAAG